MTREYSSTIDVSGLGAPFRALTLKHNERGLVAIDFDRIAVSGAAPPRELADPLYAYLHGERIDLAQMPIDLVGTDFQLRVWKALLTIPYGEVRTYGDIAADLGDKNASRAVGGANGRNALPLVVPCHRVLAAGRKLGGYSGGLDIKEWLLAREGITVSLRLPSKTAERI